MVTGVRYLPNGEQMKSADTYTIQTLGIPSLVLMERAALAVVADMKSEHVDLSRALVVCGSGNNGGDGFAVARLLKEEGYCPEVFFAGRESSMSEECAVQKRIVEKLDIPVVTEIPDREYTVIIDAVFGVGLSREITGRYAKIIDWMNSRSCGKVAVDIPSGICSGTGQILGTAFRADLTVSMACVKVGSELYPGKKFSGKTKAAPIGISTKGFDADPDVCLTFDKAEIPMLLPKRKEDSHKGTYGKVLMITGSTGMAGAAYLSARAAYAAGAGLVQIYTAEDNRAILQQLLPEAIISCYTEYSEAQLDEKLSWADVICIGCGLGQSAAAEQMLARTLERTAVPCVIDADGLNMLGRHMELLENVSMPVILTPHMLEMSRLTGKSVAQLKEDRIREIRAFTDRYPVVCALKDSRTVVASGGRHPFLNLAGNSAMAKAGSGDVLAGVITGLAAQGLPPFESACTGVFLHACGGDRGREKKGAYSLQARDLIDGVESCLASACGAMIQRQTPRKKRRDQMPLNRQPERG